MPIPCLVFRKGGGRMTFSCIQTANSLRATPAQKARLTEYLRILGVNQLRLFPNTNDFTIHGLNTDFELLR